MHGVLIFPVCPKCLARPKAIPATSYVLHTEYGSSEGCNQYQCGRPFMSNLTTPDGRYFVVKGQLWRCTNPMLAEDRRESLVKALMAARRGVKEAKASGDPGMLQAARATIQETKVALGERGPVWWSDGSLDFNRHMVTNTPYAEWYAGVVSSGFRS